jgi:hypothetical protein
MAMQQAWNDVASFLPDGDGKHCFLNLDGLFR